MPIVTGRIEKDGKPVLENVGFTLIINEPPRGLKSWAGAFTSDLEHHFEPGDKYRIVLDDGRSGDMLIKRFTLDGRASCVPVEFVGTGPLA